MAEELDKNSEIELTQKFQVLSAILPNGDWEYLRTKCLEYIGKDAEFEYFVSEMLTDERVQEVSKPSKERYFLINTTSLETIQYSLQTFVKRFKDPVEYFHKCPKGPEYKKKVVEYLKDRFRIITNERINQVALENDYNLMLSINKLEETPPDPIYLNNDLRGDEEIKKYIDNGDDDFLYEVEFVEHKDEILDFMKIKQDEKEDALEKAKILGELLECECCSDQEVLAEEVVTCENGHVFCSECFERSVEVIMGDGKVEFPCFQECNSKFPMTAVKQVLTPKAYEKLMSRIQYREVRAADVPGMEFCPFCDYGVIPAENDELFLCQKCFINFCRKCWKEDHKPRACNESPEEYRKTQERIKSEEQQTYDFVRICKTCNVDFIKESGCNKMTCSSCGTNMCYLCREIIQGYDHFNNGACPLHDV